MVRKLVLDMENKIKANNVTVVKSEAIIRGQNVNGIEIICNGKKYYSANLLICTGSRTAIPPICRLSEAGDSMVTNHEILKLKAQPPSSFCRWK